MQEVKELAVYTRNANGEYVLEMVCAFEFKETCSQFYFNLHDNSEMLFFNTNEVLRFKYLEGSNQIHQSLYKFKNPLNEVPKFGVFSKDQNKFIITSSDDVLYVDMQTGTEIDFDSKENVSSIENILADDDYFYVLANKKEHKLGYFLF